jgi:hypothetical protein
MDDSAKLTLYRYRRGSRQRAAVLVNAEMHPEPRAAVEVVLGPIEDLVPVEKTSTKRTRERKSSMDVLSQSLIDQLFADKAPDASALRSFGSRSAQ